MTEKEEWFPTRGGTYVAYQPEWFDGDKWKIVPTAENHHPAIGVPQPGYCGGINKEIGMFGYDQAMALAHQHAAVAAAYNKKIEVRVVPYKIVYDLKAQRIDKSVEGKTEGNK